MYQALYRKYRPSTFDEVVGQTVIVKTLKNAILHSKLTHAYLFTGPRGTGKTSIAKILAKTINCENLNGILPCNKCVSCTQINNKQTTDIIEIDAASNTGVDQIRELKSKINLVPATSKYKVYIIDEVHMLSDSAFNALLKTLEEPPSHVIFVLATTEPHKIPATILSRCQRFDFQKINQQELTNRLKYIAEKEKINISDEALAEVARLADGGMRDAISMLDQLVSYTDDEITVTDVHEINGTIDQAELKNLIKFFITENITEAFKLLDKYDQEGKNFVKLSEEIINYLKNLLFYLKVPDYFETMKLDKNNYVEVAQNINVNFILNAIDIFNKTNNDMKNSNQEKTLLELAIIKLLDIKNIKQHEVVSEIKQAENKDKKTLIQKEKKIIENEKVIPKIKKPDEKVIEKIKAIKSLRINNTLAKFNRKELLNIKNKIDNFKDYILDMDYSQFASMIVSDAILKAASDENLVFVFENANLSDFFNENLPIIEKLACEVLGKKYKIISTYSSDWEVIKKEFNSKTKTYEYQEETENLEDILKNDEEENEIVSIFGNIVEYQ